MDNKRRIYGNHRKQIGEGPRTMGWLSLMGSIAYLVVGCISLWEGRAIVKATVQTINGTLMYSFPPESILLFVIGFILIISALVLAMISIILFQKWKRGDNHE